MASQPSLPWRPLPNGAVENADGLIVAGFLDNDDRRFALCACNIHDKLLATCKRLRQQFADEGTYDDQLNAVIAQAEAASK